MKIPLTKGLFTLVDEKDFEELSKMKWTTLSTSSGRCYAIHYFGTKGRILLHRHLLKVPKGFDGDHINGDTLDNRRSNLRIATRGQNIANSKLRKDNTSGYKGVYMFRNKWVAHIQVDGKKIWLGGYDKPEEASEAYKVAAQYYFGQYYNEEFREEKLGY